MQKRSSLGLFVGTASALIAASALGCGGGRSICERNEYCEKSRGEDYIKFTLHVES